MIAKRLRMAAAVLAAGTMSLGAAADSDAASNLSDVWCGNGNANGAYCLAVGASDSSGPSQLQVKRWTDKWAAQEAPAPSGVTTSELAGISCTSEAECFAVGSVTDDESATRLLIYRWHEGAWGTMSTTPLENSDASRLSDVTCVDASTCFAVGFSVDAEEVRRAIAFHWNGSAWTTRTVPLPTGAGLSELTSVSCVSTTSCVAVGSFVNSSDVTKTMAVTWNGQSWAIESTPEPAGAELSQLEDVSCRPSEACTAVGQFFDATGDQKTLALRRATTGGWTVQSTPNPPNALARSLTSVTCPSATLCRAVGVVEVGRREIPVILRWDGTGWSEEPLDVESLGATAVRLTGVACSSTTDCHATGDVRYGRATARRNVAFRFNGTSWALTEDGGFEHRWATTLVSQASSRLNDVSCPTSHRCLAVGDLVDDDGMEVSQVGSWRGGHWSTAEGPSVQGAEASSLVGVDCTSTSSCWAVGSFVDEQGQPNPLMVKWDGELWVREALPPIAEATAGKLLGIDCESSQACTAVGSIADENGEEKPLALSFDGTEWKNTAIGEPESAAHRTWLTAVSCTTIASCVAVGAQADPFGHETPVITHSSAGAWTWADDPPIAGNPTRWLQSVDCASGYCLATGGLRDEDGTGHVLAFAYGEGAWSVAPAPDTSGYPGGLTGRDVACATASTCMLLTENPDSGSQPPAIFEKTGSSWEASPVDAIDSASGNRLSAISCSAATACNAVGHASYGGFPPKNLSMAFDGEWYATGALAAGGGLRGASCISAEFCIATGDSVIPSGDAATSWVFDDAGWDLNDMAAPPTGYVEDVHCLSEEDCVAIGRQGAWPWKPLAERWNGSGWAEMAIPAPDSNRSANLTSISCSAASWCVAAGFTWAKGPGPSAPLIERWNGTTWALTSAAVPAGAVSVFLNDVSCVSPSACTAVGAFTDAQGLSHGLVESWNGTSWTATQISGSGGAGIRLLGVDCTSTAACAAVGRQTAANTGAATAISYRWNGAKWDSQSVPALKDVVESTLAAVDCYSSARCIAVGSVVQGATRKPVLIPWESGAWKLGTIPAVEGAAHASLESVSCPSAGDCMAVGYAQSPGTLREPLAFRTLKDAESADTPPLSLRAREPRLTVEQEQAALQLFDEDPVIQAALGTSEYEVAAIGPWTETDESGQQTIVGVYLALSLEDSHAWSERAWRTATYPFSHDGYEEGTYRQSAIDASASGIVALQGRIDTEVDGEGTVIDGEVVAASPLPFDLLRKGMSTGKVEIDPSTVGTFNEAAGAY